MQDKLYTKLESNTDRKKEKPTNPLVSIIVITYNSSKYVLETLKSAKAQTYQNIELIVSDDCSIDNTVELCENWIEANNKRFVSVLLITSRINTGVSPNCNRGLHAAKGEWVKFIAGDDTLTNNSISSFIEFKRENPLAKFIVSNINITDQNGLLIRKRIHPINSFSFKHRRLLRNILKSCFISAAGIFIERKTLESIGGFDERFEMQEDYPLYVKLAQANIDFYYLKLFLVNYRTNDHSIWNQYKSDNISQTAIRHFNSTKSFYELELLPALKKEKMYYSYFRASIYIRKEEKRINKENSYRIYDFVYMIDPKTLVNISLGLIIRFSQYVLGNSAYLKVKKYVRG